VAGRCWTRCPNSIRTIDDLLLGSVPPVATGFNQARVVATLRGPRHAARCDDTATAPRRCKRHGCDAREIRAGAGDVFISPASKWCDPRACWALATKPPAARCDSARPSINPWTNKSSPMRSSNGRSNGPVAPIWTVPALTGRYSRHLHRNGPESPRTRPAQRVSRPTTRGLGVGVRVAEPGPRSPARLLLASEIQPGDAARRLGGEHRLTPARKEAHLRGGGRAQAGVPAGRPVTAGNCGTLNDGVRRR